MSFPPGFLWGAATSAYQIEGACDEDGKGPSIWDTFAHVPGAIERGDTGDVACDHYHRFREDVALMAELGLGAYRFSVSWPRVLPAGTGTVNERGLDFYDRLVDELLAHGIHPFPTLYHWDLPQALHDRGGWEDTESAAWFAEYAGVVAKRLGDRVTDWTTLNEPGVAAFVGYEEGRHAPGIRERARALHVAEGLIAAHRSAGEAVRAAVSGARIGVALDLSPCHPASGVQEDFAAAERLDADRNRRFLDPLASQVDFVGVNYYTPTVVRAGGGPLGAERVTPTGELTEMGWLVYPAGLTEVLLRVHRNYGPVPLVVTENGAACEEGLDDPKRLSFLRRHVTAAHDAVAAGVPLMGYFVWSFLDNFEWDRGYSQRFGIVHVDYATQRRTLRRSGEWYRDLLRPGSGLGLPDLRPWSS